MKIVKEQIYYHQQRERVWDCLRKQVNDVWVRKQINNQLWNQAQNQIQQAIYKQI